MEAFSQPFDLLSGQTLFALAHPAALNASSSSSLSAASAAASVSALTTAGRPPAPPSFLVGLCRHPDGWGPYAAGNDFTPCAEQAVLVTVEAAYLALALVWAASQWRRRRAAASRVPSAGAGAGLDGKSSIVLRGKLAFFALASVAAFAHLALLLKTHAISLARPSTLSLLAFLLPAVTLASTALSHYAHVHTCRSSDLVLIGWSALSVLAIPYLRTTIRDGALTTPAGNAIWSAFASAVIFGAVGLGIELLGPRWTWRDEGKIKLEDGARPERGGSDNPFLTANFFERLTFSWLTPLMKLGSKRYIDEDDVFSLNPTDEAAHLHEQLSKHYAEGSRKAHAKDKQPSLFVALAKAYGGPYATATVLKLSNDLLMFLQPQLLRSLLQWVASYKTGVPEPPIKGFCIAALMFLCAVAQTSLLHQYFDRAFTTGMRVKSGIVMLLYRKALVLSNGEKAGRTTGDIVNLQSVDAMRIADLMQYGQMVLSGPFQIILAFVSLYNLLGWSAFCGVAVMLVSLPLNAAIARYQKRLQVRQMAIKDKRTRLMNEILSNIKSIKLYSWERAFRDKVLDVRNNEELPMIRRIGVINAISGFFWASTPFMVAFATFAAYSLTSPEPLTSDRIFPAISLFSLLSFPLAVFSNIISSIIESLVSEKRLVTFLEAGELDPDARIVLPVGPDGVKQGEDMIKLSNASFSWSAESDAPATLKDVDFVAKSGELVAVLGRVGDGKTSLLSAILGEMTRRSGSVTVRGSIAYLSQSSWVLSATIRENILFGHSFDPVFYERVLEACALGPDLKQFAQGDQTEVGEKGIGLSGGQRARLALARAVYSRADVYLLDDPLCAVDNHVAAHLFKHVIGPTGLLKDKARVLCTNSVAFLASTDRLLMLRAGEIAEQATYDDVMEAKDSPLYKLIAGLGKQGASGATTPGHSDDTAVDDKEVDLDEVSEKVNGARDVMAAASSYLMSPAESKRLAIRAMKESTKPKEKMERGSVKGHVYKQYIAAASTIGVIAFIAMNMAAQAFQIVGNLVLRSWGDKNLEVGTTANIGLYLFFYGMSGLLASALNMASSLLIWTYCAIRCSRQLHDHSFSALMRSPMSFFETTPQGRILNLFSRDIYVIDEVLIRTFTSFFRTLASVGGVIFIVGLGAPIVLVGIIPTAVVYRKIMLYYLATSRELKRLDSTSRAPIFSWFGESLTGLSTIRAFGQTERFSANSEAFLDRNNQCYLPSVSVNRWLAVRLEFLGSLIMGAAALVSIFSLLYSGDIDPGLVGITLSYVITVTGSLNWVVRSASDVETNIVSAERVIGYGGLPSEAADEVPENEPPVDWPQQGAVRFESYVTRYRPELPPCIKGITLDIRPGEKIGVCGRTGAGKSSLTLALLRVIEASEGSITIDGVDISTIGLHDLRSRISIIPQDPQLFEGDLRQNIDPVGDYTDDAIWEALTHSHLRPYAEANGGLDGKVAEGGQNLSSGQRQLLCFARALLRKSKILLLDEATSAVDLETDAAVQAILQGPDFAQTTMITVAHRLDTIIASTRVLVMEQGEVAEFDTPEALLAKKDSVFYSLASAAGLVNVEL